MPPLVLRSNLDGMLNLDGLDASKMLAVLSIFEMIRYSILLFHDTTILSPVLDASRTVW
jgi:hypothetical protein